MCGDGWEGSNVVKDGLNFCEVESIFVHDKQGFIQGFSIALLNPKILAWMLALYTPFIENNVSIETLLGMGFLGMIIDGTWYVTVALALTTGGRVEKLKSISHIIDGAMGVLMFVFAGLMIGGVI